MPERGGKREGGQGGRQPAVWRGRISAHPARTERVRRAHWRPPPTLPCGEAWRSRAAGRIRCHARRGAILDTLGDETVGDGRQRYPDERRARATERQAAEPNGRERGSDGGKSGGDDPQKTSGGNRPGRTVDPGGGFPDRRSAHHDGRPVRGGPARGRAAAGGGAGRQGERADGRAVYNRATCERFGTKNGTGYQLKGLEEQTMTQRGGR